MDTEYINHQIEIARAALDNIYANVNGPSNIITSNLQLAINNANEGDTLIVSSNLVEPGPIVITKPLTLASDKAFTGVPSLTTLMPSIRGGLSIPVPNVIMQCFDLQKTQDIFDIVLLSGDTLALTGCRILGDTTRGQKRGIAANGPNITIDSCLVDNIFLQGQDCQGISGWDNTINLVVMNSVVYASTENILIGGTDPASQARQPRNFTLINTQMLKHSAWRQLKGAVKNSLELKNCIGATISDNIIDGCWADGQTGSAVLFTPRNQGGTAPYSQVADVLFKHNTIRNVCGFVNLLASDNLKPSQVTKNIQITDNTIDNMDRYAFGFLNGTPGIDKAIQVGGAMDKIVINNNVFTNCKNVNSCVYFYPYSMTTKNTNFDVTNNKFPTATYGNLMGDSTAPGLPTWNYYVSSGVYNGNTPLAP